MSEDDANTLQPTHSSTLRGSFPTPPEPLDELEREDEERQEEIAQEEIDRRRGRQCRHSRPRFRYLDRAFRQGETRGT